jgi:hypothetical protein
MDQVAFVGIFFVFVFLFVVIYYATTIVPRVRTLGQEKPVMPVVEVPYNTQFAPLLGWQIRPYYDASDSTPYSYKKYRDASGNYM